MIRFIEASPTVEFFVEPRYADKMPTPEILSKIEVLFMGNKNPISIEKFLSIAKDRSNPYQHDAAMVLGAIKKLAKEKKFYGNLLQFIWIYFVGNEKSGHNVLDLVIKSGSPALVTDNNGRVLRTDNPIPTYHWDTHEIKKAEEPRGLGPSRRDRMMKYIAGGTA